MPFYRIWNLRAVLSFQPPALLFSLIFSLLYIGFTRAGKYRKTPWKYRENIAEIYIIIVTHTDFLFLKREFACVFLCEKGKRGKGFWKRSRIVTHHGSSTNGLVKPISEKACHMPWHNKQIFFVFISHISIKEQSLSTKKREALFVNYYWKAAGTLTVW